MEDGCIIFEEKVFSFLPITYNENMSLHVLLHLQFRFDISSVIEFAIGKQFAHVTLDVQAK
jgi:hypothetical protein